MKKWSIGILLAAICTGNSYAQNGLYYLDRYYLDDPYDETTHLRLGMNLLSDNVYMGRKDKDAMPYITPYIGYYFRNGIYVNGSISYGATNEFGHFDRASIDAGYDHVWGKNFLTGIYGEQYFYYTGSASVSASITQRFGIYGKYRNDLIEPQLDVIYNNTTTDPDYAIELSLDHHFRLSGDKLHIYPAFSFFTGTGNFYNNYLVSRISRENGVSIGNAISNTDNIKGLNVELSAKTILYAGHWMFTLRPVYAIPIGDGYTITPNGIVSQKLKGSFFVDLDICFRRPREEMIR